MILDHWSQSADPIDVTRIPLPGCRRRDKPTGFWISVRGPHDWSAHLASHGIVCDSWRHRHSVTLAPDARLLVLADVDAVLAFTREYGLPSAPGHPVDSVDWDRVEAQYPGIMIAPFQTELRRDPRTRWYFGWDCACICVWDAAAIASVTPS